MLKMIRSEPDAMDTERGEKDMAPLNARYLDQIRSLQEEVADTCPTPMFNGKLDPEVSDTSYIKRAGRNVCGSQLIW